MRLWFGFKTSDFHRHFGGLGIGALLRRSINDLERHALGAFGIGLVFVFGISHFGCLVKFWHEDFSKQLEWTRTTGAQGPSP